MPFRNDNDRIPSAAAGVLLVTSIAELNFVLGPRLTVEVAGTGAWIVVIPAAALVALSAWIAVWLIRAFPKRDLLEIATLTLGRPLGVLLGGAYVVYWLLRAGQMIQVQTHVFRLTLLEETPRAAVAAYIVLLSAYLVAHGIEPLARTALLIAPAHLPLVAITVPALFTGDFGRLIPIGPPDLNAALRGVWSVFCNAPGVEVLLMIAPFLSGRGSALRSSLYGIAFLAVLAVLLQIALLANFGVVNTKQFTMPTLELSRVTKAPGFEGFRLDPVFVVMWFVVTFASIAVAHYMAATAVRSLFRAGRSGLPVFGTAVAMLILGAYPIGLPQLFEWVEAFRLYGVPVMSMGIPLALMLAALARRARGAGEGR